MTIVPPPAPPPDPWGPTSSPPGRSQGPIIAAICAAAVLLVGGGLLVAGALDGDDDESGEASAPAPITEPPDDTSFDPADASAVDLTGHQLTLTFNRNVSPSVARRVEREWRANPHLDGFYVLDAAEVEDATGYPVAAIAAWFGGDDLDDVERFACAYSGQPGVAMVGIDDTPCASPPTPPEVIIEVTVGRSVSAAHRETIRHAMQDNGFFDDLALEGGTGEPGTWTQLRLSGFVPGAQFVCPDAAAFVGDPGVRVREIGPVDGCPEF